MSNHGDRKWPVGRPSKTAPSSAAPAFRPRLIGLILFLVTILLYLPVVQFGFVGYDDGDYFSSNWRVLKGLSLNGAGWAFGTGFAANWHPLTWLSLMLDAGIFGNRAIGPHFTNLILHAANAVLLFHLLRRITGFTWRSLVVGALFAVHPLHVESVAWISERKDVLSTFFGLLALYAYAIYAAPARNPSFPRSSSSDSLTSFGPAPASRGRWRYWLALVFFVLGLMSKPMLVTLPFVMLLLDFWPLQRLTLEPAGQFFQQLRRLAGEKWPFLVMGALSCGVTLWVQFKGGAARPLGLLPFDARLENAVVSYLRYLGKAVWPTNLAVLYPLPDHWPAALVVLAVLVLGAVSLATIWWSRRCPFLTTGWLWFLGTLIPVIGLVQVGIQSMADRYMYIPIIGLFILGVWSISEAVAAWKLPQPALTLTATFILATFALRTRDQLSYWRDGEVLFRHAIAVTEHNDLAASHLENNLGNSLYHQGQLEAAVEHYRKSLQYFPNYPLAHNNLGIALLAQGQIQAAMSEYSEALRLQPKYANAHVNLADALLQCHQEDAAIDHYRRALAIEPDSAQALNTLGSALRHQGKFSDAAACGLQVIRLRPDFGGGYDNLAEAFLAEGEVENAVRFLRQALRLDPADPRANFLLGTAFARQGNTSEARHQFGQVLKLAPDFPGVREQINALENAKPNTNGPG